MFIVKNRKIFYAIAIILIGVSAWSLSAYGLNEGIDFKGGSLVEISFPANSAQTTEKISDSLVAAGYENVSVRAALEAGADKSYIIRMNEITLAEKDSIIAGFSTAGETAVLKNFNTIGPTLGSEAKQKSVVSIILVLVAIVFFITFAFRKVSRSSSNTKMSSWIYGLVAIVSLAHDIIIPLGAFSILGHIYGGFEVDTLFVTALLVILGFSIHDTIVVFDRVRENLSNDSGRKPFEQIVGESVSETFTRSVNTSLTTLLAIATLYILGPESTHHFALALLLGVTTGTYSSIFIGSPLLVTINNWKTKMK